MTLKKYYYYLLIFLPLFAFFISLMVKGEQIDNIIPIWSDEVNYYHIIESMIDYGQPLGANGYNGSSAILGNFGFHGFVILLPYFIFAYLFGLQSYSIAICNVVLVMSSLFVFYKVLKPEISYFFLISTFLAFSPMIMIFYTINMIEGVNIFIAVCLAACFIRLICNPNKKIYIITFLLIVFATLSKVTWGVAIFPWLLLYYENKKYKKFLLKSIAYSILFVMISYLTFMLVSAQYFESQPQLIINLIQDNGIGSIPEIFNLFLQGLVNPFIAGIESGNIFFIVISVVYIFMIVINFNIFICYFLYLIRIRQVKEFFSNDNVKLVSINLFMFFSTYFGVALLYTSSVVALRTLYPILTLSFIILVTVYIHDRKFKIYIMECILIGSVLAFKNDIYYDSRFFATEEYKQALDEQMEYLRDNVVVNKENNKWENTISAFIDVPMSYWLAAPSGSGYNLYLKDENLLNTIQSKYVLIMKTDQELINKMINIGFEYHDEDTITVLLIKNN